MAKIITQTVYIPDRLEKYLEEINKKYTSFSKFVQISIEKEFGNEKNEKG